MTRQRPNLLSTVYSVTTLLTALMLSWLLLLSVDFGYGFWYDAIGIDDNISEFGPENRYRDGFEDTSREQRLRLFAQIVDGVSHSGTGLEDIVYTTPRHDVPIPLLRHDEIVHLQDVANLIDSWHSAGAIGSAAWLLLTAGLVYRPRALASLGRIAIGYGLIALFAGVTLALLGFEKVFYQLHIWIFPEDHPWFFYYQDSLMSTMMKAPDLFMYIGLAWIGMAVPLFCGLYIAARRLLLTRPPLAGKPPLLKQ